MVYCFLIICAPTHGVIWIESLISFRRCSSRNSASILGSETLHAVRMPATGDCARFRLRNSSFSRQTRVSVPTKCMKARLLVRFELREFTFSDCYMGRAQFRVHPVEGSTLSGLHTKRMCTVSSISHSVVLPWEGEPNAKIVQL